MLKALECARMRLPRPKSLSSLMLTGFALVSVPLLLAVVIAATKVRALSEESAALVRSGVETAHLRSSCSSRSRSIERSAKLYQVLNDPGPDRGLSRQPRTPAGHAEQHRDGRRRQRPPHAAAGAATVAASRRRRVAGARAGFAGGGARRGRSDCTDVGRGVRAVRLDRRAASRPACRGCRPRRPRRSSTCSGSRRR